MTADLRFGVVGCAGMGKTHADAVGETEGAVLAACADVDADAAEQFAEARGVAAYADAAEMVADADLDAVCVCTPNGTHAEIVETAAEAGAHVLAEKPLDVTPERVNRVVRACEDAGVKLGVCLQRRTMGGPRLAREAVAEDRLGPLTLADVQVKWKRGADYYATGWRGTADLDGGILHTQALHGLDLLQWICGGVDAVCAALDTLHHDGIEVPDTAAAALRFSNGAFGTVSASTAVSPQYPITVQVHGVEGSVRWHQDELDEYSVGEADPEPFELGYEHVGLARDFVRAIREDRDPYVSGRDALAVHDAVFAAFESEERGEWVATDAVRESV